MAQKDLLAGITVGIVFIPQAIAYAFLAGIPPIYGLYSGLVPLLIYSLLGTSKHLSIGPVAITSILLMQGISPLATPFTDHYLLLVLTTGFFVGILQIVMGVLRLGFLVTSLAQPVISGFISAAAIIIMVSQLKNGLGINTVSEDSVFLSLKNIVTHGSQINIPTVLITLFSIILLAVGKKVAKNFPISLVLTLLFTALSYFLDFEKFGIAIIGEIPKGLPQLFLPDFTWGLVQQLFPTIITLTIIGYIGSIGIAKSFQMKHRDYVVNPNRELIALGFSKTIGTFFQGNLASGSYSRSAINEDAGAKTQISTIVVAFLVLMTLLFLTPLLYYLPKAVLAAIIFMSVTGLIKIKEAYRYLKIRTDDFLIMLITFITTLFFSVEIGILTGVLLSFVVLQYKSATPHIAELIKIPNTEYFRNLKRFPNGIINEKYLILRFDDQLYFGNADYFKESIFDFIEQRKERPNYLIIHATNIHNIDSSGLHMLENLYKQLSEQGINLLFSEMIGPVRDILTRSGFMGESISNNQFMSIKDAVEYLESKKNTTKIEIQKELVFQYNERKWLFNLKKIWNKK